MTIFCFDVFQSMDLKHDVRLNTNVAFPNPPDWNNNSSQVRAPTKPAGTACHFIASITGHASHPSYLAKMDKMPTRVDPLAVRLLAGFKKIQPPPFRSRGAINKSTVHWLDNSMQIGSGCYRDYLPRLKLPEKTIGYNQPFFLCTG
jgi:hypothetical protein